MAARTFTLAFFYLFSHLISKKQVMMENILTATVSIDELLSFL